MRRALVGRAVIVIPVPVYGIRIPISQSLKRSLLSSSTAGKIIRRQRLRTLNLQDEIRHTIDALLDMIGKLGDGDEFASIVV